ncbi:MAG: hypothetical protein JNL82_41840 [Myxococcales bacterium]|nr:hypothetical protein [Myxococcales bacterium]
MALPALFLTLAMAPAGSGAAAPWRDHEAECHRLADAAKTPGGVSADGLAAAGDACRTASEGTPALGSRAVLVLDASSYYRRAAEAGHAEALCRSAAMLRTFAAQLDAPGAENRPHDRAAVAGRLAEIAGRCPAGDEAGEPRTTTTKPPTPEGPKPSPYDHRPKPAPARRPLRIAGGAALGVGLALGGGMVAALVRGASLGDQAEALRDKSSGQAIGADDASTFAAITRRGELADHAAIGLGVAAGALSVAGAALVVLDARRSKAARFAIQPSILPTAGIRLALEF